MEKDASCLKGPVIGQCLWSRFEVDIKSMPIRVSGRLVPKYKRELPSFVQVLSILSVNIFKVRPTA